MNGADSEPRRHCQRQQRGKMTSTTQVTSVLCRRWWSSRNHIFGDQSYFCRLSVSDWFWLSEPMFICSRRSHGPLLCAFCLCFHFNNLGGGKFKILNNFFRSQNIDIRFLHENYDVSRNIYIFGSIVSKIIVPALFDMDWPRSLSFWWETGWFLPRWKLAIVCTCHYPRSKRNLPLSGIAVLLYMKANN